MSFKNMILLIIFNISLARRVTKCPLSCTCGMKNGMVYVNCASRNYVQFPDARFIDLSAGIINLNYNKIKSMDFNVTNEPFNNVQRIELKKNTIQIFSTKSLSHQFPNLERLDLWRNQIGQLQVGKGLKKLRYLDLSYNRISQIEDGVFQKFPALEHLDLEGNKLEQLNRNIFKGLKRLTSLNIAANRITILLMKWFDGLESLGDINLKRNRIARWTPLQAKWPPSARKVDLSGNLLRIVPATANPKQTKDKKNKIVNIDINDNPIYCGCRLNDHTKETFDNQIFCGVKSICFPGVHDERSVEETMKDECKSDNLYEEWKRNFTQLPVCVDVKAAADVKYLQDIELFICHGSGVPTPNVAITNSKNVTLIKGEKTVVFRQETGELSDYFKCSAVSEIGEDQVVFMTNTSSPPGVNKTQTPPTSPNQNTKKGKEYLLVIIPLASIFVISIIAVLFYKFRCKRSISEPAPVPFVGPTGEIQLRCSPILPVSHIYQAVREEGVNDANSDISSKDDDESNKDGTESEHEYEEPQKFEELVGR